MSPRRRIVCAIGSVGLITDRKMPRELAEETEPKSGTWLYRIAWLRQRGTRTAHSRQSSLEFYCLITLQRWARWIRPSASLTGEGSCIWMLRNIQTGGGPATKACAGSQSLFCYQPIPRPSEPSRDAWMMALGSARGPQGSRRGDAPIRQHVAAQPGCRSQLGRHTRPRSGNRTMDISPIVSLLHGSISQWQLNDDRQHAPSLPTDGPSSVRSSRVTLMERQLQGVRAGHGGDLYLAVTGASPQPRNQDKCRRTWPQTSTRKWSSLTISERMKTVELRDPAHEYTENRPPSWQWLAGRFVAGPVLSAVVVLFLAV
ncbi:hypothetical protein QBC39DRAFT_148838 [Podospora conica]|nr:hypothetical protein QBC39DRAFT_148838 [Schizothecium conicum]